MTRGYESSGVSSAADGTRPWLNLGKGAALLTAVALTVTGCTASGDTTPENTSAVSASTEMGSTVGEATMPAPEQQASMTEADAYVSEQTKQLALAMLDTLASPDATQQQDTQLRFGLSDQGEGQAASGPHVTIAYEAPKEDSVDPDSIHLAFAVPQSVADTLARDGVTPSTIRGALEGSGTRFAYGDVRLNTEGGRVIYANYFVGAQGNGPDGSEIPDIDTGSAATFVNTIYYGAGEHFGYEAVA